MIFGRKKPPPLTEDHRTELVLERMEAVTGRMEDVVNLLERRLLTEKEDRGDKDR